MSGDVVPRTRSWQAVTAELDTTKILHVVGEIELGNTNEVPHLDYSDPQGHDPRVVNLDVEVRTEGSGERKMHWAEVTFSRPLLTADLKHVRIMWMGVEVAMVEIEDVD